MKNCFMKVIHVYNRFIFNLNRYINVSASKKLSKMGEILVLEKDGTRIDNYELLVYLKSETFMLMEKGDIWQSENSISNSVASTVTNSSNNSTVF